MANQSFQQKRIVELSRELDSQREKNAKMIRDGVFLTSRVAELQEEVERAKNKQLQFQITLHQTSEQVREMQLAQSRLKQELQQQDTLRSAAELQNVRQRQKIDELHREMESYETKTKGLLYDRAKQLGDKDSQIYSLKQENIEIEKLYLRKREEFGRIQQRRVREMAKLFQSIEILRGYITSFRSLVDQLIVTEKGKQRQDFGIMVELIQQLEGRVQSQTELEGRLRDMQGKLEEVVSENSQKIIELYKLKYCL